MPRGTIRLLLVVATLLGATLPAAAATSWYDAAGALAAGVATSDTSPSKSGNGGKAPSGATNGEEARHEMTPESHSGSSSRNRRRTDEAAAREEAERFRQTMRAIVAEYDRIGAGELAQQCIDASRIVQIAENPSGWREILFLLAGLVSLIAALFITKILASMFKIEIAQLLWIPIAGCLTFLIGLFMAIRAAKKRKAAVAAGIALSAAGVISFVDPVRHAFFGIVADVFVIFTAWYVPLVMVAGTIIVLLVILFFLCNSIGGGFGAIGAFLLRNTIGLIVIPGVCAVLFLAILSVVEPWFTGHAGELAAVWEEEAYVPKPDLKAEAADLESLRQLGIEVERDFESLIREIRRLSSESESETHDWHDVWHRPVIEPEGQPAGGGTAPSPSGASMAGRGGAVPFAAYPRDVRLAAAEMARAAEGVYDGRLPRGAKPFDGFLPKWKQEAASAHEWNGATGMLSTQSGLAAQVFQRSVGWHGSEMVVVFRGTASAKDGLEDWRQLLGTGRAPQYAEAAALVRAVRASTDLPLVVFGHSLGGGQTQYAVAMNQGGGDIRGVGFNPAGLSANSVRDIELRRGEGDSVRAARSLAMVRLDNDPVSTAGMLLGRVVVVDSGGIRGFAAHSITTLAEAMERASK